MKGPDVTESWQDEARTFMKIAPGEKAMVAGFLALSLLDEDAQRIVTSSDVDYVPHAFVCMSQKRSTRLGHVTEMGDLRDFTT